jgi:hypothetical protein
MTSTAVKPTGRECPFGDKELIVSKANLKGHIAYANDVFSSPLEVSNLGCHRRSTLSCQRPLMADCVEELGIWPGRDADADVSIVRSARLGGLAFS